MISKEFLEGYTFTKGKYCGLNIVARFWANVDKNPLEPKYAKHGCWVWRGEQINKHGMISIFLTDAEMGKKSLLLMAKRISWIIDKGLDPMGRITTTCENKLCIKPDHLRIMGGG